MKGGKRARARFQDALVSPECPLWEDASQESDASDPSGEEEVDDLETIGMGPHYLRSIYFLSLSLLLLLFRLLFLLLRSNSLREQQRDGWFK